MIFLGFLNVIITVILLVVLSKRDSEIESLRIDYVYEKSERSFHEIQSQQRLENYAHMCGDYVKLEKVLIEYMSDHLGEELDEQ